MWAAMVTTGRRRQAPVDLSFREWAMKRFGEQARKAAEGVVGPAIYDANPGRLSAAFVFEPLLRVTTPSFPPSTRYPRGGWAAVIGRMERHARTQGVQIETGSRITEFPETGLGDRGDLARGPRGRCSMMTRCTGKAAERPCSTSARAGSQGPVCGLRFDEGAMIEAFRTQPAGRAQNPQFDRDARHPRCPPRPNP